jgi:hypothetical protein
MALTAAAGCGSGEVRLFAGPDDTPQSIRLTATAIDARTASLAWTSAGGGLSYRVERDGTTLAVLEDLTWTDRSLVAGRRHCWRIHARSGFGWQARSGEACLGTDEEVDGWRVERLGSGRWPAIALDAAGVPHACWTGSGGVSIAWIAAGAGSVAETVDGDGSGQCSLAVAADGTVHVAYLSRFGLRHAVRENGAWRAATVDADALAGTLRTDGPALALAADGAPRIAYRRGASGATATVALVTRSRAGWTFDLTGIRGRVGPHSLAVGGDGTNWLATTDDLGQSAIAWRRAPGGWTEAYRQSLAPTRGDGPPIALDAGGFARIVWWQREAPTTTAPVTLRWAQSSAGGWRAETVATVTGVGTRVAIGAAGDVPRLAAVEDGGVVRTYRREGGRWIAEALPGQRGTAEVLDLAVDAAGRWRLVHDQADDGDILLATRSP